MVSRTGPPSRDVVDDNSYGGSEIRRGRKERIEAKIEIEEVYLGSGGMLMKRRLLVFLAFVSLIVVAWLGAANPFNLFVTRSDRFSMEEFRSIQPGTDIADAIKHLGKPINIVHGKDDLGCPNCEAYYFLGDPPRWLPSYQEAWLLVDRERVVTVTVNSEP